MVDLLGRLIRALPDIPGKGALVRYVLAPALRGRGLVQEVPLQGPGGGVLRCSLDDWIPWNVFVYGRYRYERAYESFMMATLKPGDLVFDIGANVGYYSVQFARLGARAVYAFEPLAYQHARLLENVALNNLSTVRVHKTIVSDRAGEQKIYFAGERDSGMSSLEVERETFERVPSTRVDTFCETHGVTHIDLVKIDVEGHERKVLEGMERMLAQGHVRHLFVELNRETLAAAGTSPQDVCAFLDRFGYRPYSIKGGRKEAYQGESESLVYFARE